MSLYEELLSGEKKLSVTGLGYVGLPIAVAFSERVSVIGYDFNVVKLSHYRSGDDPTGEVGSEALAACKVDFTSDPRRLREASFHIVSVPTPIDADKRPDLSPLLSATETLGKNLRSGSVVVYESTVYPGVTEEICVPLLEKASGMVCGKDFFVGYSPERINPGDRTHRLQTVVKIVSGMDAETLETIASVYSLIAKAGVYRAENIKVAEAAKVIENSQRDINIAFMNELSKIFDRLGIDTQSVLAAARTKWNFLDFTPGLVGGHCIGVDPYYLTYKAEQSGYHSEVILAGRRINDGMGAYIASVLVKKLVAAGVSVKDAKVAVLGLTFKENCPDTRNTRVIDIISELADYGIKPLVCDPVADRDEARTEYGVELANIGRVRGVDAVIVAVAHEEFRGLSACRLREMFSGGGILIDVKGIYDRGECEKQGLLYWRL